jgi:hypothetical protein
MKPKVILLHGFEDDSSVRGAVPEAALPDPETIAFATTTPSNLRWKVEDLMEHVSEEHETLMRRKGASS